MFNFIVYLIAIFSIPLGASVFCATFIYPATSYWYAVLGVGIFLWGAYVLTHIDDI